MEQSLEESLKHNIVKRRKWKKEEQNIGEESSAKITWKENTSQKKWYRLRYFFNISMSFI